MNIEMCIRDRFLGDYARNELAIDFETLMALGRQSPTNTSESFNMAHLAIRGSGAVNGVSRLHGVVSRQVFNDLFPRWPTDVVPTVSSTHLDVHKSQELVRPGERIPIDG